jgi:hypothetical protein
MPDQGPKIQYLETYSVDRQQSDNCWVGRYLVVSFDMCVHNCFKLYKQFWRRKVESGRLDPKSDYLKIFKNHTSGDYFNIQLGFWLFGDCTTTTTTSTTSMPVSNFV